MNLLVHQIHLLSFQFDSSLTHSDPFPIDAYLCTRQNIHSCASVLRVYKIMKLLFLLCEISTTSTLAGVPCGLI